jgi:ABC-type multidrug transport system fused ATPase/permease subunit
MRYFIGIVMVALGVVLVLKTEWFIQNFGTNGWAEEKLGTAGGTRTMYKLFGIILIFFGFLAITNLYNDFLINTVGKIFVR